MKNWTIKKRITLGFGSVLLLVVLQAGFSLYQLHALRASSRFVATNAVPGTANAAKAARLIADAQVSVLRALQATSPEELRGHKQDIDGNRLAINNLLAAYEKTIVAAEDRAAFTGLTAARSTYVQARDRLLQLLDDGHAAEAREFNLTTLRPSYLAYQSALGSLVELNLANATASTAQVDALAQRTATLTTTVAIAVVLCGSGFAALLIVGLGRQLSSVAETLEQSATQIAAAAGQVSSSSQTLAEGASEQAASLEETSSSLEELASTTKNNSASAEQANTLAKAARGAAERGTTDMQAMSAAMDAIKLSGGEIAKINKAIDEIAFQTNILALNAAVEAARAGSAGAGFAVVAEEVRNLAQRSALAARETAAKIEDSIQKSERGVSLSSQVATGLGDIVAQVRQLDTLVDEVAHASREQSSGIDQLNTAVTQMDHVTQSNAASAEEGASAAEELHAQAASLKDAVGSLLRLVDGGAPTTGATPTFHAAAPARPRRTIPVLAPATAGR